MLVSAPIQSNQKIKRSATLRRKLKAAIFGFTLIELMVTLVIAAIFAALATPSFRDLVAGQRVKTAAYDISYTLTGVRSEALKRNLNVVLAPGTGGWQNGWTITAGVGGPTLGRHEVFSDLTISGPATNLTYNSSGRLIAAVTPFTVSSSVSSKVSSRCISIDLSGLPNSKAGAC